MPHQQPQFLGFASGFSHTASIHTVLQEGLRSCPGLPDRNAVGFGGLEFPNWLFLKGAVEHLPLQCCWAGSVL